MANAQDSGGSLISFDVAQTLRYTTNDGFGADEAFRSETRLGFSYRTETRRDSFSFSASSGFVLSPDDDVDTGIAEPTVSLNYTRSNRSSEFTVNGSYRSIDLDQFVDGDPDGDLFELDSGTRTDINGSIGLVFGRDAPFGGNFNLSQSIRDYSDTTDPDLLDTVTTAANGGLSFRFDDRITGRVSAGWTEVDEDGGADRTTLRFGTGVDLLVNQTLTTSVDLDYVDVETVEAGTTTTEDGLGLTLRANKALRNGTLSGRLSTDIDQNGRNNSFSIDRDFELKNGNLGFTVGGNQSDAADFSPLYGLRYNTELVRGGNLNADLTQSYRVETDGDEEVNTNFSVSYDQALSRNSNFSTGFSFRDKNVVSGTENDENRWDFNVQYRHSLTRDWGLVGGYTRSYATEDGQEDRSSDSVFLTIDRSFGWRP